MGVGRISGSSFDDDQNVARQTELLRDRLGSALRLVDELAGTPEPVRENQAVTEKAIRGLIRFRRNRDRFFEAEMFADPAWDILLELYASELGQQRVSVTHLCACAAVPATTALRWISALQEKGLIERRPDPLDGRRHFISLTGAGAEAMDNYFRTVPAGALLV